MADANVKITAGSVKFEEFSGDDVESYIERLEQHLIAWELDGDDEVTKKKRKAILISSIGGETYRVLKDVLPGYPCITYVRPTSHASTQLLRTQKASCRRKIQISQYQAKARTIHL